MSTPQAAAGSFQTATLDSPSLRDYTGNHANGHESFGAVQEVGPQLLTHPVHRLENYRQLTDTLTEDRDAIKVFMEVKPV